MEDILQVGAIASTHGVRGEVKVYPMTDDVERFKDLKEVLLDTGREMKLLHVKSSLVKKSYGTSISENPDECKRFLPGGGVDLRAARAYNGGEFFCTARRREDDQLSL